MLLSSLDWALRGGTVALVLMLAGALMRDHGRLVAARLGAVFAVGTAAYAVTSAAGFAAHLGGWTFPLLALAAGNNVVFWLFAASLFDDGYQLKWWHLSLWSLLVIAGTAMCLWPTPALGLALTLSSFAFAALAVVQAVASWRSDLVEGRRRLRLFVVTASSLYIGLTALSQLAGLPRSMPAEASLAGAVGLLAIAGLVAWFLLRIGPSQSLFAVSAEVANPVPERAPSPEPAAPELADGRLVDALAHLMTTERAYRQDGLTIGTLAQQLGLPEYRLRRLINQALGYRNFNSFVNHYRIAEIKAALSDPRQAEVPVLTIALDAGFNSLGPFNRAFKAETGLTPSEYRRLNGGKAGSSGIDQPISESASRIPSTASSGLGTP